MGLTGVRGVVYTVSMAVEKESASLFSALPQTAWFVVCDTDLRDLLARAAAGENPDLLLVEFYANTKGDADGDS